MDLFFFLYSNFFLRFGNSLENCAKGGNTILQFFKRINCPCILRLEGILKRLTYLIKENVTRSKFRANLTTLALFFKKKYIFACNIFL